MTKDEALKMALEALKTWAAMQPNTTACSIRIPAIAAIEKVLAQPEQYMKVEGPLHVVCQCDKCKAQPEQWPLGWHTEDHLTDRSATTYSKEMAYRWECKGWPVTPFYASPPKGL